MLAEHIFEQGAIQLKCGTLCYYSNNAESMGKGESNMNFFGKNIDKKTIDTIAQILNTPEGQKLKQELSQVDKNAVLETFKRANLSQSEIDTVTSQISRASKEEILQKMRNANLNDLNKKG